MTFDAAITCLSSVKGPSTGSLGSYLGTAFAMQPQNWQSASMYCGTSDGSTSLEILFLCQPLHKFVLDLDMLAFVGLMRYFQEYCR